MIRPSRSGDWSSAFIDGRVTKAPHASSEPDRPGRCASSSRQEQHVTPRPRGRGSACPAARSALEASQAFLERHLGLVRSPTGPPHAVVLQTAPIAFALRDVVPGTDLASAARPGIGAGIWLHATDVQDVHDALVADGRTIVAAPVDGPFGRTFTVADPDGYHVTLHDRA